MNLTFIQTSDPKKYLPYLEMTSKTISKYCSLHEDCSSRRHVGVIRGFHPWQACFNRISLIREILQTEKRGWIFYLDADAYIIDMDFDLQDYLAGKTDYAMVAAKAWSGPCEWWNINDGIFALNLEHPSTSTIISMWAAKFAAISDAALRDAIDWNIIPGDQALLHSVFQEASWLEADLYTDDVRGLMNSKTATFARQVLRRHGDLVSRLNQLRNAVEYAIKEAATPVKTLYLDRYLHNEEAIKALYECLLLRPADDSGLAAKTKLLTDGEHTWVQAVEAFLTSAEFRDEFTSFASKHGPQEVS